ncbi:hypothetical protein MRY87_12680 [bacterium]|nr:hypothetical protein [bacterium]
MSGMHDRTNEAPSPAPASPRTVGTASSAEKVRALVLGTIAALPLSGCEQEREAAYSPFALLQLFSGGVSGEQAQGSLHGELLSDRLMILLSRSEARGLPDSFHGASHGTPYGKVEVYRQCARGRQEYLSPSPEQVTEVQQIADQFFDDHQVEQAARAYDTGLLLVREIRSGGRNPTVDLRIGVDHDRLRESQLACHLGKIRCAVKMLDLGSAAREAERALRDVYGHELSGGAGEEFSITVSAEELEEMHHEDEEAAVSPQALRGTVLSLTRLLHEDPIVRRGEITRQEWERDRARQSSDELRGHGDVEAAELSARDAENRQRLIAAAQFHHLLREAKASEAAARAGRSYPRRDQLSVLEEGLQVYRELLALSTDEGDTISLEVASQVIGALSAAQHWREVPAEPEHLEDFSRECLFSAASWELGRRGVMSPLISLLRENGETSHLFLSHAHTKVLEVFARASVPRDPQDRGEGPAEAALGVVQRASFSGQGLVGADEDEVIELLGEAFQQVEDSIANEAASEESLQVQRERLLFGLHVLQVARRLGASPERINPLLHQALALEEQMRAQPEIQQADARLVELFRNAQQQSRPLQHR